MPKPKRWNQHSYAHKTVRDLQINMAHEVYDTLASKDNKFYKEWNETEFVNMLAPQLRDQARSILAEMLSHNDLTDREKEEIYEALLLDHNIPNEDRWYIPKTTLIQ